MLYLFDVISRLGSRSVLVAFVLALVIATVVFGLSIDDASARIRWTG